MQNNYPFYNYIPQQGIPNYNRLQPQLKGQPVSSIEEARAAAIDFDGSIFYFPDTANNIIYTKQLNMDGTSSFRAFKEIEIKKDSAPDYVSRAEFTEWVESINKLIESKGENKNVQSDITF